MSSLLLKSILFANALQKKPNKMEKDSKIKKALNRSLLKRNTEMCRICDKENGNIPIFNNHVQPTIPEDILQFTGVMVSKSDNFSRHMCQYCLDLLNGCIMFKEMCQKTNKKLIKNDIKKEVNCETDEVLMVQCSNCNGAEEITNSVDCADDFFEENSESCFTYNDQNNFDLTTLDTDNIKQCTKKIEVEPAKAKKWKTKKKKWLCDVCGKTAQSHASLIVHKTTHEDIFPFKCDVCPYMGKTFDLLKVHKRIHLPDKPFKCPHCTKTTTTASNLTKHVRRVHDSTRPFKCSYCDRGFTTQHDVKRHVKEIHLRQGTVECEHCNKKFSTRKILRVHQWKVHKIKPERLGRMPAYLQYQIGVQNETHNSMDRIEMERAK